MSEPAARIEIIPGEDGRVLVSLQNPEGSARSPCDICCVVDVSGSMGAEAMVQQDSGASQGHGLSVLDVVKHALKTIILNLEEGDRLSLVAYSNDAQTVFDLTGMDAAGRRETQAKLEELRPGGMTNLWDGMKTGVELLKGASRPGRLQHVMLFTDGLPNINPPRGILPMVQRLKDKEGGKLPCTVSTFGFGYELDSELLSELAIAGCGSYAFIPDAGFVGTVFVNAMTNLLVTFGKDAVLKLTPGSGATFAEPATLGGHSTARLGEDVVVNLGCLQLGQSKDVVVQLAAPPTQGAELLRAELVYVTREGAPVHVAGVGTGCPEPATKLRVAKEVFRLLAVDAIRQAMKIAKLSNVEKAQGKAMPLPESRAIVHGLCAAIAAMPEASADDFLQGLLEDLAGQVHEALSKEEWFSKWGVHYLPSLMSAHLSQTCNNFKDAGVQSYGGQLFSDLRDRADDIFCSLPPPQPAARATPPPAPAGSVAARVAPVSMSAYYDRYSGCLDGESLVEMADGTHRRLCEVVKGDVLSSPGAPGGQAEVLCVVRTAAPNGRFLLSELPGGLRITPWHPVRLGEEWRFPADIADPRELPCRAVYSLVLSEGAGQLLAAGVACVSLGHCISEGAAAHAFFGSRKAVEDLQRLVGFDVGLVQLAPENVVRDEKTGMVSGFVPAVSTMPRDFCFAGA